MARKKHLINVHTSTGTTAPTGASLYLGEIAVQHTTNDPALWIKVGSAETSTEYEKFIGRTEIMTLIEDTKILGSGYTYSGLSYVNSATSIADAYSALTSEVIKDEKIISAAFNDLNDRINDISGNSAVEELVEYVQENEEVVAGALNELNERVGTIETQMTGDYIPLTGYELASGTSEEELSITEEDTVNEAIGKLQKQMLDNEESIAAGLNDLNTRLDNVDEAISHSTGITQLSGAVRSLSAATYNISDGLNELYNNVNNNTYGFAYYNDVQSLSAATHGKINQLSGATQFIGKSTLTINMNGVEQGKYTPLSGNTTINLTAATEVTGADVLLTGYELASGTTEEELAIAATDTVNEAFGKIQKQNYDNEAVIAGSLNDLDERIAVLEANSGSSAGLEELSASVISNRELIGSAVTDMEALSGAVVTKEYVIASALNDLNDRVLELSGNTGGGADVAPLSAAVISLSGAVVTISGNTGGGGGNYDALSAATHTHVTNNDIHVTSSQKTSWTNGANSGASAYTAVTALSAATTAINGTLTTVSGAAHTKITNLSGATTGINATLTAHTGNGDIHVTANQKTTWSGKQDAISDLSAIRNGANSGASAYTAVTALSAATTAHTGNNNIHVTAEQKTNWTNSGTSGANAYVGYIAHSANTGIHVTSTEKSTWNGKQDAITDLESIRSNAASGMAAYNNVNALSGATTAMSANVAKIAVTGVTVTGTGNAITNAAYSNSALTLTKGNVLTAETLTGVSAGGTNVTVTSKVAAIPSASTNTFGVVKTGDFITNTNGSIAVTTGTNATSVARGDHSHSGYATTGTLNTHTAVTIASRTSSQMHLPTVSASDNGKILRVVNGAWALVDPVSIYSGTTAPNNSQGQNGDIYLQTS